MNLINLTRDAIVLVTPSGERITIPPSGAVARVTSKPGVVGVRPGFPVPVASPTTYGTVEGIPNQRDEYRRVSDGKVFSRSPSPNEENWWGVLESRDGEYITDFDSREGPPEGLFEEI